LEDVAAFVEKIGERGLFWRFVYQKEDGEELGEYRTKITTAQVQFLVSTSSLSFYLTYRPSAGHHGTGENADTAAGGAISSV
jgi:hypothetical protein